jgi:hypothetical protein
MEETVPTAGLVVCIGSTVILYRREYFTAVDVYISHRDVGCIP